MNFSIKQIIGSMLLFSVAIFSFSSCSKDDEIIISTVEFDPPALFVTEPSAEVKVNVITTHAKSLSITTIPEGWSATLDGNVITVTSPAAEDEDAEDGGYVGLYCYSVSGYSTYAQFHVSRLLPVDLSEKRSNCYIITKADCNYLIPIDRKGENGEAITPVSVGVIWQSPSVIVQYPQTMFDETMLNFYVKADDAGDIISGNALLGAYDEDGKLLWTWHIWVTESEPTSVGRYMDRNLGANSSEHDDEIEILDSYGLYYQWGRVTPFVGPMSYDCASSYDAAMYGDGSSSYEYILYEDMDEAVDLEYALQNPLSYLISTEDYSYDWLVEHNPTLWSATGEKSLYDPCPKGWRVADSFEGFEIADDLESDLSTLESQYGWNLRDGDVELFFTGGGRRSWLTGRITNVNTNSTPKPWIGYYWTSKSGSDNMSEAMYFTLDTEQATLSELKTATMQPRANGMLVRCVRE